MRKMIAVFMISLATMSYIYTQTSEDLWKSAAEKYEDGDYHGALLSYLDVESDQASSELYFNLGNCYYQLDSAALSILYFEKALKLNPRDRSARDNLSIAVSLMDDPIPAIDEFFLKRWLNGIGILLPPIGWGLVAIVFLWLAVWLLIRSLKRNTLRQDRLRYGLPAIVFLCCLFGAWVAFQNYSDSDYAIVMESISVKVAPDEFSTITRSIDEGEKVVIIDMLDDFYKVRFVNYEHGWLPKTAVRRI